PQVAVMPVLPPSMIVEASAPLPPEPDDPLPLPEEELQAAAKPSASVPRSQRRLRMPEVSRVSISRQYYRPSQRDHPTHRLFACLGRARKDSVKLDRSRLRTRFATRRVRAPETLPKRARLPRCRAHDRPARRSAGARAPAS